MKKKLKYYIGKIIINCTFYFFTISKRSKSGNFINNLYQLLLHVFHLSAFPIENNVSYKIKFDNTLFNVLTPARDGVTGNTINIDSTEQQNLIHLQLPEIKAIKYKEMLVAANSDVVVDLKNKCIINDMCYNINNNVEFVDGLLYRQKYNFGVLRNNFSKRNITIKSGIMINGKFSNNYYHAMYENLIRLLYVEDANIPQNVPILVDETVFRIPSLKKIFEILTGNQKREVVVLQTGQTYFCEELYCIDHVNYIAPHIKDIKIPGNYYIYDHEALIKLRNKLLIYKSEIKTPKRIFLTRKNTQNRHLNEEEVFSTLKKYDFETVSPEKYSFEEQIALFNNAEWIVGGTGAAFTNLLFTNNKCKILCFRSNSIGKEPPVFNTIAYINGCKMWYYSPDKTKSSQDLHSDYSINIEHLEKTMQILIYS